LGEVHYPHCVTLRTSFVGHELKGKYGLVEWFLAQHGKIRGFTKAIYSGLPTIEIARIIDQYVLPNPDLSGLYHVSSNPISKYDLLKIIAAKYLKEIDIEPDESFVQDRSIDSEIFRSQTGYIPPQWPELIDLMHKDYVLNRDYYN
jgi:dTDP-4-dehydrorhamnose reductase